MDSIVEEIRPYRKEHSTHYGNELKAKRLNSFTTLLSSPNFVFEAVAERQQLLLSSANSAYLKPILDPSCDI